MIQVRCPECGFLQTISEERFLTISDDFINCPHCHARLPKKWTPAHPDNIPEEAKHKIIAFSRRILNGGAVNRPVVVALEALVRRHGQLESSLKALGVGYASLREHKKAEEFFSLALRESPEEIDIQRWLAKVKLALEKFDESYAASARVMDTLGGDLQDEDLATAALSLTGLGRTDEAQKLLDAHPNLDASIPLVKQAFKTLGRGSSKNSTAWGTAFSLFNEWVSSSNKLRLQRLREKAIKLMKTRTNLDISNSYNPTRVVSPEGRARMVPRPFHEKKTPRRLFLEYWIYSAHEAVPDWEMVRKEVTSACANDPVLKPCTAQLDHLVETSVLSIEYVRKDEAEDLFSYPEDVLPRNSRGLQSQDLDRIVNARLIVRVRFMQKVDDPGAWLNFVALLVDNFQSAASGVVQDVISHTLWGEAEWKKNVKSVSSRLLDFHINCEAVDESDGLWIHTHGMQKFGLPELELEAVPNEFEVEASKLLFLIAQTLLDMGPIQGSQAGPFPIQSAPYSFTMTMKKPDDEAHFPGGSAVINAFGTGGAAAGPRSLKEVLAGIGANIDNPGGYDNHDPEYEKNKAAVLKQRMLQAHRQARRRLPNFKRSFRKSGIKDGYVHAVKVRFDSDTGDHEWMWVSLDKWNGISAEGFLENEPILMKQLRKGTRVNFSDQDIFDWVIVTAGQILEGGFTEALKMQAERPGIETTI